jgi:hypothetical protein
MPPPDLYHCRKCGVATREPDNIRRRWCGHCETFGFEIENQHGAKPAQPIQLDLIIGGLLRGHRLYINKGSRPSLLFEQSTGADGFIFWRACLLVDGKVSQHSRREQLSPQDALRELELLCQGVKPEDI